MGKPGIPETIESKITMALIQCPECSGQISQKAWFCPHCGEPNPRAIIPTMPTRQSRVSYGDGLRIGAGVWIIFFVFAPLMAFLALIGLIALGINLPY